ncbi:hypothetical protein ID866_7269 [Astraeus odoratus]|nr:hypothetical protein ID866_7269 [Astraeus odoratus]
MNVILRRRRFLLRPQEDRLDVICVGDGSPYSWFSADSGIILIKEAFREPYIWSLLHHPNIHPLLGVTTCLEDTVISVAEWMVNGNANDYIKNQRGDPTNIVSSNMVVPVCALFKTCI